MPNRSFRFFHRIAPLAIALLPLLGWAQADPMVQQARQMIAAGEPQKAFDLLVGSELEKAGDPDYDLVLGIAANEAGDHSRAIFALQRVLAVQPDNLRAKAEMGRALFAVGDIVAARKLLLEVKAQGAPDAVVANINKLLQATELIESETRSSWGGFVEAGAGYDTNANSATAFSSIYVPAYGPSTPVTLYPSGVKIGGAFASLLASVSGRHMIDPRWSLFGTLNVGGQAYNGSANQFDNSQIGLNAGVGYRVERNEFLFSALAINSLLKSESIRQQTGLAAEWIYRADAFSQLGFYGQASRLGYPQQSIRDVDRYVLGMSYARQLSSGLQYSAGAYLGEEDERNASVPFLGHRLAGVRAGFTQPVSASTSVFVQAAYEKRRFSGVDPQFLVTREDWQGNLNLGLVWFPVKAWRITPQLLFTRTDSNIVINEYQRTVFSLTARYQF